MNGSQYLDDPMNGGGNEEKSAEHMFYARFRLDDSDLSDGSRSVDDFVFPPISFTYNNVVSDIWEEIDRDQEEDQAKLNQNLRELARSMHSTQNDLTYSDTPINPFYSEDEIMQEFVATSKFLVTPPGCNDLKSALNKLGICPLTSDEDPCSSDGASSKKLNATDSKKRKKDRTSEKSDCNKKFAFVKEVSTSEKKLVEVKTNGELPEGVQLISADEDISKVKQVPEEFIVPLQVIQGALRNTTSQPSTPAKLSPNVTVSPVPAGNNTLPISTTNKSSTLAPLEDLMKTGKADKTPEIHDIQNPTQNTPAQSSRSGISFKKNVNADTSKVTTIVNTISPGQKDQQKNPMQNINGSAFTILTIAGKDDGAKNNPSPIKLNTATKQDGQKDLNPLNKLLKTNTVPAPPQTPSSKNPVINSSTSTITGHSPSSLAHSSPVQTSATTTNQGAAVILCCKICGWNFSCYNDSLFKKHVFVKHDVEISDNKYFDECRKQVKTLPCCLKCNALVLNKVDDHYIKCKSELPRGMAFKEHEVVVKAFQKLKCGICGQAFCAKYELNRHLEGSHSKFASKIIMDPAFRCAGCLKRFTDSLNLTKHVMSCNEMRPSPATILELARCSLDCDICGKMHATTSDTNKCYFDRSLIRCMLCFAVFKDKNLFFKHLHLYHGLQLHGEPRLILPCPMCPEGDNRRGKYSDIFPHILTDHYQPTLNELSKNSTMGSHGPLSRAPTLVSQAGQLARRQMPQLHRMPNSSPRIMNGAANNLASSPTTNNSGGVFTGPHSTPTAPIVPTVQPRPIIGSDGKSYILAPGRALAISGSPSIKLAVPGINTARNSVGNTGNSGPRVAISSPADTARGVTTSVVYKIDYPKPIYGDTSRLSASNPALQQGSTSTTTVIKTGIPSAGVASVGTSQCSPSNASTPLANKPRIVHVNGQPKLDLRPVAAVPPGSPVVPPSTTTSTPSSPSSGTASTASTVRIVDLDTLSTVSMNSSTTEEPCNE